MFARDQFLNRVGIAGVRNGLLRSKNTAPAATLGLKVKLL
jgi:hypothetical protein